MKNLRFTLLLVIVLAFAASGEAQIKFVNETKNNTNVLENLVSYTTNATLNTFNRMMIPSGTEEYISDYDASSGGEWTSTFEFAANGKLYYLKNGGEFGTIDTATGATTVINTLFGIDYETCTAMAYNWENNMMYALCENYIFRPQLGTVDLETGKFTYIGTADNNGIIAMDFDNDGNLYGLDFSNDAMVLFDLETGKFTQVGTLGVDVGLGQDISFDRSSEIMYSMMYVNIDGFSKLTTIDLSTGAATILLDKNNHYACLAIANEAAEVFQTSFMVKDTDGNPVADASVVVDGIQLTTNSDGMATKLMATGTYNYVADGNGYASTSANIIVVDAPIIENITLNSVPLYNVTFNVTKDGVPVEYLSIGINGTFLNTNTDGIATIILEDGTYPYTTDHYQCEHTDGEVVVNGADTTLNLKMLAWGFHAANFLVVDKNNNPINSAAITINGETKITDSNGKLLFPLMNGDYNYKVSATGFPDYSGDITIEDEDIAVNVVLELVSIDEYSLEKINVYPNPSNGIFTINAEENTEGSIYNINGVKIMNFITKPNSSTINATDLSKGLYIIKFNSHNYSEIIIIK